MERSGIFNINNQYVVKDYNFKLPSDQVGLVEYMMINFQEHVDNVQLKDINLINGVNVSWKRTWKSQNQDYAEFSFCNEVIDKLSFYEDQTDEFQKKINYYNEQSPIALHEIVIKKLKRDRDQLEKNFNCAKIAFNEFYNSFDEAKKYFVINKESKEYVNLRKYLN